MSKFNNPFICFKYPNFRLYWIGMNISLIGSWMQTIALPWLALTLTNDAFLVALVGVAQFIPPLFLTLFSGALIDKFDKKLILLIAQIGLMIVALIFSATVFMGIQTYEKIVVLAFISGIFNSIDAPSRQSMVHDLIDDNKDLPNAIALNSMSFNVARILGPSLGGAIIGAFGIGHCFLINAISFLAIIISLCFIKFPHKPTSGLPNTQNLLKSIKEGLVYVKSRQILVEVMVILLVMATFIPNYNITISALVKFSLDGSEKSFGYLMSALGVGSFFGAFFIAITSKSPNFKLLHITPIITSLALCLIGFVGNFYFAAFCLMVTGFGFVVTSSSINSILQLNTKDEFRGRVLSIYVLIFQGSTPFGALFAGYVTQKFGVSWGCFVCGFVAAILLLVLKFSAKKATI